MREAVRARTERAIAARVFPGCVIGVTRGGSREVIACGSTRYEGGDEVTGDTVYDIASVTKAIAASLASMLVAEGRMALSDSIARFVPELRNDHGATIEDLLRYRVRGPKMSALAHLGSEALRARLFESGFEGPPGESHYSNMPAYMLGIVLERASGTPLASLARNYLFSPLGMRNTWFGSERREDDAHRVAPTEIVQGEEVRGVPHDESARVFARAGHAVAHAGLFSTAPDLLAFLEALRQKYPRLAESAEAGLGWSVHEPFFMGSLAGQRTIGKTGFTGCAILADRERDLGLAILSNRTYPTRPPDAAERMSAINAFRRDIADIVGAAH